MSADPRFLRAQAAYARARIELEAGRMTPDQFEQALEAEMIEHQGRWWMLGANSGQWYVHDGRQWILAAQPVQSAPPTVAKRGALSTGCLVLVALVLGLAGLAMSYRFGGGRSLVGSAGVGLLVLGAAILGFVFRPRALLFAGAALWTLVGLAFLLGHHAPMILGIWWWPDLMLGTGIGALAGGAISRLARR